MRATYEMKLLRTCYEYQEFFPLSQDTELGRYMRSSGVGGYLNQMEVEEDTTRNNGQEPSPAQPDRWNRWGSTYGFICGRHCSDVSHESFK
jgi:hypothetical protein